MSKQTPIETWDSFDDILKAGTVDAMGFDFSNDPHARKTSLRALESMAEILERLDKNWTTLFEDDREQMTLWKNRLYVVRIAMQDVIAAVADRKHELDWDDITRDLGLINAFRMAAELAIDLYQSERKQLDTVGCA